MVEGQLEGWVGGRTSDWGGHLKSATCVKTFNK